MALLAFLYLLRGTEVPRKIALTLAIFFFALAIFKAWQEQYRARIAAEKALADDRPKLSLHIDEVIVGTNPDPTWRGASAVFLVASVTNTGSPSIADEWNLSVRLIGAKEPLVASNMYINQGQDIEIHGRKFSASDALYIKSFENAIGTGRKLRGILYFRLDGVSSDLLATQGTQFILKCKDALGASIETSHTWTGRETPPQYFPGLKTLR